MEKTLTLEHKLLPSMTSIIAWTAIALLAGGLLALIGLPGIFAVLALALLIIFGVAAAYHPVPAMVASIWCLGLCPFVWGLQTGVLPKLFGDESLLLLYLAVLPFLYLFTARRWCLGFQRLYVLLALYVVAESLSFVIMPKDLIAFRNFLETSVLGPALLVLFLNEAANVETEKMAKAIVWLTTVIAGLSILERIVQRNPIMESVTDITYMSPQLVQLTEGVYRPYVSFFHPSEAGAFMAMGIPFAIRHWKQRKSAFSAMMLAVIAGGLSVNATRGAWVGAAVAVLLLSRNVWKMLMAVIPATAIAGGIAYVALKDTPFIHRLTDPDNLYSRFEYWKVSLRAFADHSLIGIGHMQFRQVYLSYIQDVSSFVHVDLAKVYVVDNMYLTTIVEHGLLGFIFQIGVLVYIAILLKRYRRELQGLGLTAEASFVRCAELALVAYAVTGLFADLNLFTKATKYFFILAGLGLAAGARAQQLKKSTGFDMIESGTPVPILN